MPQRGPKKNRRCKKTRATTLIRTREENKTRMPPRGPDSSSIKLKNNATPYTNMRNAKKRKRPTKKKHPKKMHTNGEKRPIGGSPTLPGCPLITQKNLIKKNPIFFGCAEGKKAERGASLLNKKTEKSTSTPPQKKNRPFWETRAICSPRDCSPRDGATSWRSPGSRGFLRS